MIKKPQVRYYFSSLKEAVEQFAQRIRDYWHVENKVHHVRDVTQGEDSSCIRVQPLPNLFALARNLALNLYRQKGFDNIAQAQRCSSFGLEQLKTLSTGQNLRSRNKRGFHENYHIPNMKSQATDDVAELRYERRFQDL